MAPKHGIVDLNWLKILQDREMILRIDIDRYMKQNFQHALKWKI